MVTWRGLDPATFRVFLGIEGDILHRVSRNIRGQSGNAEVYRGIGIGIMALHVM